MNEDYSVGDYVVIEPFDKDLKEGDIIEPELGRFVRVLEPTPAGTNIYGHIAMEVPIKNNFIINGEVRLDLWTEEINNRCLDLIIDARDEMEKDLAIMLMAYVKNNYG